MRGTQHGWLKHVCVTGRGWRKHLRGGSSACAALGGSSIGKTLYCKRGRDESRPTELLLEQSAELVFLYNQELCGLILIRVCLLPIPSLFFYLKSISIDEEIGLYFVYQVLYYFCSFITGLRSPPPPAFMIKQC